MKARKRGSEEARKRGSEEARKRGSEEARKDLSFFNQLSSAKLK